MSDTPKLPDANERLSQVWVNAPPARKELKIVRPRGELLTLLRNCRSLLASYQQYPVTTQDFQKAQAWRKKRTELMARIDEVVK